MDDKRLAEVEAMQREWARTGDRDLANALCRAVPELVGDYRLLAGEYANLVGAWNQEQRADRQRFWGLSRGKVTV